MAGRKSHTRSLSVWTNGQKIGLWRLPARGDMELTYDLQWMAAPSGRPLSLSLPYTLDGSPLKGARVSNFFENLLPDSDVIRRRLATRFRTASIGAFDLLQAIGRDCVGAVQLLAEDEQPVGYDVIEGTPLTDDDVEQHLARVVAPVGFGLRALEEENDFRISLAGAQEKSALLWHDGRWMRPHGATPTTHIMKLPLGLVGNSKVNLSTSVENEWLSMNIMQAYGLPTASCEVLTFGRQRVLSVKRFDRQLHSSGKWLMRLPQEDFCQALGVAPHLKYEADGGPGIRSIAAVLRNSFNSVEDLRTFVAAQIIFWMLAAPDGHAKNFSLQLLAGGAYRLTPLYDVMSIWPVEGPGQGQGQWSWHKAKMAMALPGKNRHYHMKDIQRRHFNGLGVLCGLGTDAEPLIRQIVSSTECVIQEVSARLPQDFNLHVADTVFNGLQRAAAKLQAMPAT